MFFSPPEWCQQLQQQLSHISHKHPSMVLLSLDLYRLSHKSITVNKKVDNERKTQYEKRYLKRNFACEKRINDRMREFSYSLFNYKWGNISYLKIVCHIER